MIRPIDMGIILKNIDEVARINKNKEVNILNQQANALSKLEQQHKLEKSKVEIVSQQQVEERFLPFVLAALLFLFVELLLRYTAFKKFP